MTKLWKIRNKETGQFSKGGHDSRIWTKGGKTWSNIGHVKTHLRSFIDGRTGKPDRYYPYHNAEIVEIEVNYTEWDKTDVSDFLKEEMDIWE